MTTRKASPNKDSLFGTDNNEWLRGGKWSS